MPEFVEQVSAASSLLWQRRLQLGLESFSRLRAVVLLGGTVRPSDLSRAIRRSLLDLPVQAGSTVLDLWQLQAEALAQAGHLAQTPLRIMIDQASREPRVAASFSRVAAEVERDPAPFRGTGGVLRDACMEYQPDDVVLVGSAGQVLMEPLPALAEELSSAGGDVALLAHGDGTPGGLMLVRCGVLETVRVRGFMDFKEQVLPQLAGRGHDIRIVRRARATGVAVRTLDGYIGALRGYHRLCAGRAAVDDPLQEDWSPTFAVVEDGASVAPSATIHDSVVLAGGKVEAGAVVVRSVVCPGGTVRRDSTVADSIVAGQRDRVRRSAA